MQKGAPWRWSGSSGITEFIAVRPGSRRVHPDSMCCALGVIGFIRGCWVYWGAHWILPWPLDSLESPWVLPGSSGVAGFVRARPSDRRVHLGSQCSLWCGAEIVGFNKVS